MSYSTWHNYGYGIRVDDIKEQSVERLQALLKLAPELDQKIRAWLSELDIAEPDWDDYMDFDQVYYLGLATILQQVIEEAEGLRLTACDDPVVRLISSISPATPGKSQIENEI